MEKMIKEAGNMFMEAAGTAVLGWACESLIKSAVKNLQKKPRLQLATSVLVSTNEATEVVKETKRKLDQMDETLKQGLKTQESLLRSLMNKTERDDRASRVGALIEDGRLGSALGELADEVQKSELESAFLRDVRRIFELYLGRIYGLVEKTSAKNHEERVNMSGPEVEKYRMSIENGVNLLRNGAKIVEWTDDLKTKYNDEFGDLEKTLDALYNRLAGIRPLQWNCGRCHQSYRTSISVQDCH